MGKHKGSDTHTRKKTRNTQCSVMLRRVDSKAVRSLAHGPRTSLATTTKEKAPAMRYARCIAHAAPLWRAATRAAGTHLLDGLLNANSVPNPTRNADRDRTSSAEDYTRQIGCVGCCGNGVFNQFAGSVKGVRGGP